MVNVALSIFRVAVLKFDSVIHDPRRSVDQTRRCVEGSDGRVVAANSARETFGVVIQSILHPILVTVETGLFDRGETWFDLLEISCESTFAFVNLEVKSLSHSAIWVQTFSFSGRLRESDEGVL